MANGVERFELEGKIYLFNGIRWMESGTFADPRPDIAKKLNAKIVKRWIAENFERLFAFNSCNVGNNHDLAIQCADARLAIDENDFIALSVKIAATRDSFRENQGCAPQLREMTKEAERRLFGAKRSAGADAPRTSLASSYLDLAELYAEGPRKDMGTFREYVGKAGKALAPVPDSHSEKKNVLRRLWAIKKKYGY